MNNDRTPIDAGKEMPGANKAATGTPVGDATRPIDVKPGQAEVKQPNVTQVDDAANTSGSSRQQQQGSGTSDRVIGAGKQMDGSLKEIVGKAVGDAKLRTDGKAEQIEGKIQNAIGGIKDASKT